MDCLNEILLNSIKCRACNNYMTEFIFLCHQGHSICDNCHMVLKECPICRIGMTNLRNYDLESIAEQLYYPCIYNIPGCTDYLTIAERKLHYEKCRYRPFPCQLETEDEVCNWSGPRSALEKHALYHHENKAWMQEESLDRWKNNSNKSHEIQLIRAYDELFYITRMENADFIYWSVQYIGNPASCKKYGYLLHIYCDNHKFRDISFNELCQDESKTLSEIIESGRCSMVSKPVLQTFMDKRKSVWYKVKILKMF